MSSEQPDLETEITRFGFTFGPMTVERVCIGPKGHTQIYVTGGRRNPAVLVTMSPKGRRIQVHDAGTGEEWKPVPVQSPEAGK